MTHPWKLSDATVAEIRRMWQQDRMAIGDVARALGVSARVVRKYTRYGRSRCVARVDSCGYARWGARRVHRIVAEAWYGPIPKGHHVHHIDGDKTNNHPDNLAVVSASRHQRHHGEERAVWTPAMDGFLAWACEQGIAASVVAGVLGTSPQAVQNRKRRMVRVHGKTLAKVPVGRRPNGLKTQQLALARETWEAWEEVA